MNNTETPRKQYFALFIIHYSLLIEPRHIVTGRFWWERVDSNHRSRNNRFTVCPIWPLWNSPIFRCALWLSVGLRLCLRWSTPDHSQCRACMCKSLRLCITESLAQSKNKELVDGLEPPTCWLQISCSTNWATPASCAFGISKEYIIRICSVCQ